MNRSILRRCVLILLLIYLSFAILIYARVILLPFILAGLLAMFFVPLANWLEGKKIPRAVSSLICVIILVSILAGIVCFFIWKINSIVHDITEIRQNVLGRLHELQMFLYNAFGISPALQQKILEGNNPDGFTNMIGHFMGSLAFILVNFFIILVYIFMLLYSRRHLKIFILKLVPENQKEKTANIISASSKATQHYLLGFGILVLFLWAIYSICFWIIGVRNPVFFAGLCGWLEIIPFVGSLTGIILTILMVISQGGGGAMILTVAIVYCIIQFTQFYLVQPFLLGAEVDINPLIAILVLIVGEIIWGLGGMVIAIPLTGIAKIIFDNIEDLQPYGYLLGRHSKRKKFLLKRRWFHSERIH